LPELDARVRAALSEAALDAQRKSMKSGLRLNAEEEELWGRSNPPSRTAPRACGFLQEDQGDNLSPTERLTAKADGLAECTASLEKIVEAAKTLYGSLGDAQKHKFITLDACSCPSVGALRRR
jgi:hypothetical protein